MWGAFITKFLDALFWLFRTKSGRFVVSILSWLGLSYGTTTVAVDPLRDYAIQQFNSINSVSGEFGAQAVAWIGVMRFDQAFTMILSALAARTLAAGIKLKFAKTTP